MGAALVPPSCTPGFPRQLNRQPDGLSKKKDVQSCSQYKAEAVSRMATSITQPLTPPPSIFRLTKSSNDETVNGNPIDRAKRKTLDPCLACNRLLSDSLADKTGSHHVTGINEFRSFARKCPMCRFLWWVFCRNDSTITGQTLYPRNGSFNNVRLYLPDGSRDIEKISITAGIYVLPKAYRIQSTPLWLEFLITYRAQSENSISDTCVWRSCNNISASR
jgi:hypothetical protein